MTALLVMFVFLSAEDTARSQSEAIPLFNGRNLDGWYTFIRERGRDTDPERVFTVEDGVIRISGKEWGCITTNEVYENYHLVVEFKWGEATHAPRVENARDSGVMLHSIGEDGGYSGIWMRSIECQMIEGGTGDLLVVGDNSEAYAITCTVAEEKQARSHVFKPDGQPVTIYGGRINWYGRDPGWQDVKGYRGQQDVEKPLGEWNRLECICKGAEITVLLNGIVVNRATNVRPRKGRIQIQSEGAEVFVRRIEITRLPSRLLVANKHDDTLSFVDPETLGIIETIPTGPNPHEMVITPDQRTMYLSNYAPPGNTISVIDLVQRKQIKQISTGDYARIHGAAIAPDGKHAYFTAGQAGVVVEVDTETNEMTRAIPTHGKISHMVLVSPDGQRLYTANIESANISVINRASGELIAQIPCGKGVEGLAITPDWKHLWAANQTGGSISIIDLESNQVLETLACSGMPVRIRFTNDGRFALVPSWTDEGELIVIDVQTKKEIKRIKAGSHAIGIELSQDGRRAFVGCEHNGGLHVIDLNTMTVEKIIQTGDGPDPMSLWFPPER